MTLAIAHRGDPRAARENTPAAFAAAVAAGADLVEIDLHRSADGVIVVVHDDTLDRLWQVPARVDELEWSSLAALGDDHHRIPSFAQVLASVPTGLMVDFTGPEVVAGAVSAARAAGAMDRCLFVTGHVGALEALRALAPEARIGLTWLPEELPSWDLLAALGAETWNPYWQRVDAVGVAQMHGRGYAVSCWTVDDPLQMTALAQMGVDAIVSNRIGQLRQALDALG